MPFQNIPLIDFHAHFPYGWSHSYSHWAIERYACERLERLVTEWDFPKPEPGASPSSFEEVAEKWAAEVERYGIKRVVFVTGGGNDNLSRLVSMYPDKFSGMAHHPLDGRDPLGELQRAVDELGLVGYKIVAPKLSVSLDDSRLNPLWRFIEERRLPVIIHFGLLGAGGGVVHHPMMSPLTLAPVISRFPDIPFVVPHFGSGYWQELLQLCWAYPNVYVDSSGSNQWLRWMPYRLELEDVFRKAYETIGPGRLIFGSDSSWFPRGFAYRYLQDQVRVCRWIGMSEREIRLFLHDNADRLLREARRRC